jgi:chromate transporter
MSADAQASPDPPARPSLLSIALTFAAISATSFGGGQKASIRHSVVAKNWMNNDQFMDGLELSQVLPGPNILNLAIFCGQRVRGVPGAIAGFVGMTVPPFAIVLVIGALYSVFASNPYVHGVLRGCAVGALGLTLGNAIDLSWDHRTHWLNVVLIVATAACVSYFKVNLVIVLVVFGGIGIFNEYLKSRKQVGA